MIIARLWWHLAADQPACSLKIKHRDLRLQQRCVDPLTLTSFFALKKRNEYTDRGVHACCQISNGHAHSYGPLTGKPGD